MSEGRAPDASPAGPVLFAYDGSDRAKLGVEEAGRLLRTPRSALVLTVWKPFDVGFTPVTGVRIDAADISEVRQAAELTAAEGASLAEAAGFRPESLALEASPPWKAICKVAEDHDVSLIVIGSHGRSGVSETFVGSVANAVSSRSRRSVLVVHRRA